MFEGNIDNCRKRYIGETKRAFKHSLADHKGYTDNNQVDKATGKQYNSTGTP